MLSLWMVESSRAHPLDRDGHPNLNDHDHLFLRLPQDERNGTAIAGR